MNLVIFIFIVLLGFTSYYFGRKKAYSIQATNTRLTALPQFYGYYLAIWCAIPAFIIYSLWAIFEPSIVKLIILSDYSNQGYLDDELNLIYEKLNHYLVVSLVEKLLLILKHLQKNI